MATSIGTLYGYTEAQLLAAWRTAAAELAAGKTIIAAGSGDVNTTKHVSNNIRERIEEIKANLYTLYLQDAVTYVAYAGFEASGCNIVRATFSSY